MTPGLAHLSCTKLLSFLLAFNVKHFICDFPLQAFPYQYKNKGTYGHPGGILHSAIHAVGTLIILVCFGFFGLAIALAVVDYILHYHIDWLKMNINYKYNLSPINSEWFWILLGADQLAHQLTYLLLIWLAFS